MNGIGSVTDSPQPGAGVVALSAKRIFSRGIHALPKRWNTCMKGNGDYIENEVIVYLLCSINYEIKIFKFLRFSFDSPLYVLPHSCLHNLIQHW